MNILLVSRIIATWSLCIGTGLITNASFTMGPGPKFIILGITIDTIQKYGMLCLYVILNIIIRNMNFNIISPWLIQNVQNTNPIQMSQSQIYQIAMCFTLYGWVDSIIYINVILSQFDIVLLEIITDIIINAYITHKHIVSKTKYITSDIRYVASDLWHDNIV